jgi:hypothetical protein
MNDLPSTDNTLVHPDRAERHILWMLIAFALFCASLFILNNFHERHPDTMRIQTVASHAPPSTPTPQLPQSH